MILVYVATMAQNRNTSNVAPQLSAGKTRPSSDDNRDDSLDLALIAFSASISLSAPSSDRPCAQWLIKSMTVACSSGVP